MSYMSLYEFIGAFINQDSSEAYTTLIARASMGSCLQKAAQMACPPHDPAACAAIVVRWTGQGSGRCGLCFWL